MPVDQCNEARGVSIFLTVQEDPNPERADRAKRRGLLVTEAGMPISAAEAAISRDDASDWQVRR